ncbi:DUF3566 domain-containing protein [Promicromonospora sp. NPDC057138]|uniref:DUF3566 domain-containing protein n=1 Tax=Promicromonospora sp. NPDC057138 TaxID=3346031 RepID=UPI0036453ED1
MTSDKSGPVRTATPELNEDLDDTRVRKDVNGEQAPAAAPDTKRTSSTKSSASTTPETSDAAGPDGAAAIENDGPLAEPITVAAPAPAASSAAPGAPAPKPTAARPGAEPPVPPAPSDSGPAVPTTGGVWRSAYDAGRSDKAQAAPETDEAKAPPGLVSAIGRASAKADAPTSPSATQEPSASAESWNRVSAPDVPPAPPASGTEGADGVRAGAMKAAQAALDAARSAAKKVSSIMPDDAERTAPSTAPGPRPEMHYTAGGVRGTATPTGASAAGAAGQQARPASVPTPEVPRPAPAGPRRVRLAISRVDPWSVMKLAFLLAVAIAIMTVVATAVFWSVLNSLGVFTTVQSFVADAVGPQSNVNLTQYVEFPRVISLATLISICNIVLLTAIATIMAFLYNITAALVGGVHMTLTDD